MDVEDLRQGWMALVKERLNEEDIFLTSSLGVYLCTPPTSLPNTVFYCAVVQFSVTVCQKMYSAFMWNVNEFCGKIPTERASGQSREREREDTAKESVPFQSPLSRMAINQLSGL